MSMVARVHSVNKAPPPREILRHAPAGVGQRADSSSGKTGAVILAHELSVSRYCISASHVMSMFYIVLLDPRNCMAYLVYLGICHDNL